MSLLTIEDLHVAFSTRHGPVDAIRGISLDVAPGAVLGIVGESGSGKSVTSLAVMRLLDRAGRIAKGRIRFDGEDITRASLATLRPLRGAAMSMIFQNPRAALNPIRTCGLQIADVLRAHGDLSASAARAKALALLEAVRIREPEARLDAYPHELSGGMCQRVMIAMAIACAPKLLIADEPTTGLDVTTQKTVMDLLAGLVRERGMAMILITHDLGLAAQYCDDIAVMEQGLVVERAAPARLFGDPQHRYTCRLVAASPTPTSELADLTPADRASHARPHPEVPASAGLEGELRGSQRDLEPPFEAPPRFAPQDEVQRGTRLRPRGQGPILEVQHLEKRFGPGTPAVAEVSFRIAAGESLGLVGESGSGKSTVSRLVCRLLDPTGGRILFDGEDIGGIPARDFHRSPHRRDVQIVFQDAGDSLNPRFSAHDSIADPIRRLDRLRDARALRRHTEALAVRVGFPGDLLDRFPHQLSGGQRARVGIARAIATNPRLLVLDEPTAALDVSVQAVILQLLDRLRRETGLAMLFVSHDLNVVRMLCDRTLVMQTGRVVEEGSSAQVFGRPAQAYTRELVSAIPHFAPGGLRAAPA